MIAALDTTLLAEVSGLIAERMGLHFPEERWPDLARGLETAGRELGLGDPEACASWLRTRELTTRQIEMLASHLTVGETYFFRDQASYEVLEREILPPLVARRSRDEPPRFLMICATPSVDAWARCAEPNASLT